MRLVLVDHDPFHNVQPGRRFRPVEHDPFANAPKVEPQIYLIRHSITAHNKGGAGKDLIRGWDDIPLSADGVRHAEVLADKLASAPLALMFTSDLSRARKTAHLIAEQHPRLPVVPTQALRTWNLGPQFEGLPTSPHVVEVIRYFVRNPDEDPRGGEPFATFVKRVEDFAAPLFDGMVKQKTGALAIVAHGRVVQVLSLWITSGCNAQCMSQRYATSLAAEPDAISPGGYLGFAHVHGHWALTERFEKNARIGIPKPDRAAAMAS